MSRFLKRRERNWLPEEFQHGHDLCFRHHDILVELLRSGEEHGVFVHRVEFRDDAERRLFEESEDVFEWIKRTERIDAQVRLLRRLVFPALLSDLLHFVYEALVCARKAKLTVAYALLRKPLQENLCLMEVIASDPEGFADKLSADPLRLRSQKSGGVEAHAKRIGRAIAILRSGGRFNGAYLAQLRYDKAADDGFDGACNQATHLFTEKDSIRTEPMNVNFIFSQAEQRWTQWAYICSRLPYVLDYARNIVEHVCEHFGTTDPVYRKDIERRVMAGTALWWPTVPERYQSEQLQAYVQVVETELDEACHLAGHERPN